MPLSQSLILVQSAGQNPLVSATVEDADSDEELMERAGTPSSESEMGRYHYQIQIAVMNGLWDLRTPLMMNLSENWGILVRINVPSPPQFGNNVSTVEELTDEELAYLRHYALKVETHMTNDTFPKTSIRLPKSTVASWKITKARLSFLQHSGQWHTTAAFHRVVALLVRTAIYTCPYLP